MERAWHFNSASLPPTGVQKVSEKVHTQMMMLKFRSHLSVFIVIQSLGRKYCRKVEGSLPYCLLLRVVERPLSNLESERKKLEGRLVGWNFGGFPGSWRKVGEIHMPLPPFLSILICEK